VAALGCLALASVVGCGDGAMKTEPVTGLVTLDGKPLAEATVSFTPAIKGEGHPGFANTNAEGRYKLQTLRGRVDAGTTPGEYVVTVVKGINVETGKMLLSPDGQKIPETKPKMVTPEKYNDREKSGLRATVVKGKNTFNFDLRSGE